MWLLSPAAERTGSLQARSSRPPRAPKTRRVRANTTAPLVIVASRPTQTHSGTCTTRSTSTGVSASSASSQRAIPAQKAEHGGLVRTRRQAIARIPTAIKTAEKLGLGPNDVIITVATDGDRMYGSEHTKTLAEYFYLRGPAVRASVARLEASGVLEPVRVAGLPRDFWLAAGARRPRRLDGQALIAPFDTLVHHRPRVLEFFDVHYRIEGKIWYELLLSEMLAMNIFFCQTSALQ